MGVSVDADHKPTAMTAGVTVGIFANMTWGLAFLIPVLLSAFDPVAITVGRYLCYGLVSVVIVLATRNDLRYSRAVWRQVLVLAVTGNVGYYFFVVQGVELAGAPAVTVIIGTLPITVALYGNWLHRDYPFGRLIPSLVLIASGLILVNIVEVDWSGLGERTLGAQLLGIGCAALALALWTWFAVSNSTFLKGNPQIPSGEWSTLIGVATLVLSLLALPLLLVGGGLTAEDGQDEEVSWLWLALGSVVLGVLVSWGGTLLWNRASQLLPVSLAGQLIVFETIFGLSYVFVATTRVPPWLELLGIAMVIAGVVTGLQRARRANRANLEAAAREDRA